MTLSSVAGILLDVTVRSSALLVLAFVITRVLRGSSAAVRHLVWATALSGAIVLPFLSAFLPPLRLRLPDPIASMLVAGPESAPGENGSNSTSMDPGLSGDDGFGGAPGEGFLEWVTLLWIIGMVLVASRLILGLIATWRLGRRSSMVTDGGWLHVAHDTARRLGATRGVTLLRGQDGDVPMTWGVLRPVIWLPVDADDWTEERRQVVLAHELAHVRRADAVTQWVGHLATVVFWFNPLVWIAVRRLHDERERACDDAVLRLGTPSVQYADHLLDVARMIGRRPSASAAMAMARHSPFEGRMQAILDRSTSRESVAWGRGVAITTMAVGLVLPMATLQPEGRDPVPVRGDTRDAVAPRTETETDIDAVNTPSTIVSPRQRPANVGAGGPALGETPPDGMRAGAGATPVREGESAAYDVSASTARADSLVSAAPSGNGSTSSSASSSASRSGTRSVSESQSSSSNADGQQPGP